MNGIHSLPPDLGASCSKSFISALSKVAELHACEVSDLQKQLNGCAPRSRCQSEQSLTLSNPPSSSSLVKIPSQETGSEQWSVGDHPANSTGTTKHGMDSRTPKSTGGEKIGKQLMFALKSFDASPQKSRSKDSHQTGSQGIASSESYKEYDAPVFTERSSPISKVTFSHEGDDLESPRRGSPVRKQFSTNEGRWEVLVMRTIRELQDPPEKLMSRCFPLRPTWVQQAPQRKVKKGITIFDLSKRLAKKTTSSSRGVHGAIFSNRYVLTPTSPKRIAWIIVGMGFVLYDLLLLPMQVFEFDSNTAMTIIAWLAQVFWVCDILVCFHTAVHVGGKLEMRFSKIARRYISTWFFVDVAVTIPSFLLLAIWGETNASHRAVKFSRSLRTLRLLRLAKFGKYQEEFFTSINAPSVTLILGIVRHTFYILLLNHVSACLWYWVGLNRMSERGRRGWSQKVFRPSDAIEYKYFTALHWSVSNFQGPIDIVPLSTLLERIYSVFSVMVSIVALAFFVSNITKVLLDYQKLNEKSIQQKWLVADFLNRHGISNHVSDRVKAHVRWMLRNENRFADDRYVLDLLSSQLKMDVLHEINAGVIGVHKFFELLMEDYPPLVRSICNDAMISLAIAPSEVIFVRGDQGTKMYFVTGSPLTYSLMKATKRGKIRSADDLDVSRQKITGGQYLSEASLWLQWTHRGIFQADMYTSILSLLADSFGSIVNRDKTAHSFSVMYGRRFMGEINRFDMIVSDYLEFDIDQLLRGEEENSPRRSRVFSDDSVASGWSHRWSNPTPSIFPFIAPLLHK